MSELVEDSVSKARTEPIDFGVVVEISIHNDASKLGSISDNRTSTLAKLCQSAYGRLSTVRIVDIALKLDSNSVHDDNIGSFCSKNGVIQSSAGPRRSEATKPVLVWSLEKRSER